MNTNTLCPSCGCACVARGQSTSIRRVRCGTCGSMIVIDANEGGAVTDRRANVVVAISRTDEASMASRTVVLREDGTIELLSGEDEEAVLVVGHAARATVSAWRSLAASPALATFDRATTEAVGTPLYAIRLDGAVHSFRGKPVAPAAARVWSMMTGLWGMVEQTPL